MLRLLKKYLTGTYNVLLTALMALFIFRPNRLTEYYPGIWKFCLTLAVLFALFNHRHRKSVKIAAAICAVPALVFSWIIPFHPGKYIELGLSVSSACLLLVCSCSIIYEVVLRHKVTLETMRGVLVVYFLLAFLFAYLYALIEFFVPQTFKLGEVEPTSFARLFSDLLYFSFVTLLTVGYGDIVAVRELGRTASVIEGIVGQFYIAMLVARIVSVYAFYSEQKLIKTLEKERHQ